MSDKVKLSVKQVNNITAEWNDQFCSITAWHNDDGVDITFSNIPTISLDNTQVVALLAILSNYSFMQKLDVNQTDNMEFKKKQ